MSINTVASQFHFLVPEPLYRRVLFNHSAKQQPFDLTITGGGVSWQKTYMLASMETKAISLRDLVEEQDKDENGNVLPKTAQSGELNWMVGDPNNGSGRLLQSDRSTGMARSFSCGYSGLLCGSSVDIFETLLPVGSIAEFAEITPITCTSGSQNDCSGQQTGSGGSFSYSWVFGTPSVASVSGSSSAANVNLLGVAAGTSQVNGQVRSQYCESGGGGQQTVQPPDHLAVVTDQEGFPTQCPSTGIYVRQMLMQLVTASNASITTDYSVKEVYQGLSSNSCGNGNAAPTSCAATGNDGASARVSSRIHFR